MYREQEKYKCVFFHFGHLSIQSVASSISFGVIYSIPQKLSSKNGITHVVCWFMVTSLEKLGISLRA